MTDAANREMCADCPLWRSNVLSGPLLNEDIWLDPEDPGDQAVVKAHTSGQLILGALEYPHPERCQRLRKLSRQGILPKLARRRVRSVNSDECPEHMLITALFKDLLEIEDE